MNYEILQGDALATLKTLPANSVQTCVTSPPYFGLRAYLGANDEDKHLEVGTEETPEAYVAKLVDVFREVRRVLHPTGTVWLNLGDSYAGGGGFSPSAPSNQSSRAGQRGADVYGVGMGIKPQNGIKSKDLVGIPWMVAFALRADGWYLRSEIIWHKKAPMPESVQDRPTKAHEQLFLLSKSPKYYYDHIAIMEPNSSHGATDNGYVTDWRVRPNNGAIDGKGLGGYRMGSVENGRNKRSVWTLGPESYSGAHFATMPTKLVEPCILAGTSAHGCCAACGSPWARVTESTRGFDASGNCNGCGQPRSKHKQGEKSSMRSQAWGKDANSTTMLSDGAVPCGANNTTGWAATCACNADVVPCTVLDCFSGSGTTGAVALKHNRRYIGLELNPEYIELSHKRIGQAQPLLPLEGAL